MASFCWFVQLPDRTSILAKGVFLVLMIGKSLLLNHSPSEWFSLYKKAPEDDSSGVLFICLRLTWELRAVFCPVRSFPAGAGYR